jgi:hypothetical protein
MQGTFWDSPFGLWLCEVGGFELQQVALRKHHLDLEDPVVVHVSPLPDAGGVWDAHNGRKASVLHGV